jgi:hypothetical protein
MAFTIRIVDEEGEPVTTTPVVMMFDGSKRVEDLTDHNGEVSVDPVPGSSVHVTVNGVDHGVHICYDMAEVEIEV